VLLKVLVTGGTGYLGRAVVRSLAARGHEVVVFARTATAAAAGASPNDRLPGRAVDGDVRDRRALERAAAGCEAICHTAALVSIWRRRRQDFDDVNVGGLQNAIDATAAAGVRRLLYTSSFLALPPAGRTTPIEANDYQRTKVAADRLADSAVARGAPLVRVYPGVIYGPGSLTEGNLVGRLIDDHLKRRLPGLIGAEHRWSYAFVDDVAAGHCAALERGAAGGRYMLGGENATQQHLFTIVERLTGRKPPRRIPYAVASALGALEELRAATFGGLPLVTRGAVDIFRYDWTLDSGDAVRDLGYGITPLADGVKRTLEARG
jgi:NAD+-dependent farnesol dehydrogenase